MIDDPKQPIELAASLVEQWDNYGRFKATEADKSLWSGSEPDDVAIARDLVRSRKVLSKLISDVGGILDLAGSHYLEWGERAGSCFDQLEESISEATTSNIERYEERRPSAEADDHSNFGLM